MGTGFLFLVHVKRRILVLWWSVYKQMRCSLFDDPLNIYSAAQQSKDWNICGYWAQYASKTRHILDRRVYMVILKWVCVVSVYELANCFPCKELSLLICLELKLVFELPQMFVNHLQFISAVFVSFSLLSLYGGCKNFLPKWRVYLLVNFKCY